MTDSTALLERLLTINEIKVEELYTINGKCEPVKPSTLDFQLREEMRLWVWYVPCYSEWERKIYLK